MKKEFLDLGRQPIANKFLKKEEFKDEFFFDLKVVFDDETNLVSLKDFVKPELMFNEDYTYHTSLSTPMVEHFKRTATELVDYRKKLRYKTEKVLEIGSNDGPFITNFDKKTAYCVEPCTNFALTTAHKGYNTYTDFWDTTLAKRMLGWHGKMDLIYSANCICHIQDLDDCFTAVYNLLDDKGMFVFEDPSLLEMLKRGSYDQIYDEHAHIFSVTALQNVLQKNGLTIFKVDQLNDVHGGSNRIYARKLNKNTDMIDFDEDVVKILENEKRFGVDKFETYEIFASKVQRSKDELRKILCDLSSDGFHVISLGATSKSTTVFNYCGIDSSMIDFISDTTPAKQGLYSPGMHIKVVDREKINLSDYDYAFLGAWNFVDLIRENEKDFLKNGGKFITHVPEVRIID